MDGPRALEHFPSDANQPISEYIDQAGGDGGRIISSQKVLAPRDDGLVRQMKTRKVVSREQIQERTETEDVKHLGDFSDEVSAKIEIFLLCSMIVIGRVMHLAWNEWFRRSRGCEGRGRREEAE